MNEEAIGTLSQLAREIGLNIHGAKVRRTSSRFCLGVEHGDYNGTELFGVGTDRFIWMAYKPNATNRVRLYSGNFPGDGLVEFTLGEVPLPKSPEIADTWARFPFGVDYVLRREGIRLEQGMDAVITSNIPGGGMSRSASLTLNLIKSLLEISGIELHEAMRIVDLAQAVENDYIGSPCGNLDQIMILFAKAGCGTHYNPADRSIRYVPLGEGAVDFRIVGLDTGTVRPGLEKSTYKVRRAQCEVLVSLSKEEFGTRALADIKEKNVYRQVLDRFGTSHPELCKRLTYIFHAQQRFHAMLDAWKEGDMETVGSLFRADGIGLRDDYEISGPELESMCDIARTVPGVLGERMLGGGDKGAAGALVRAESVEALKEAVDTGYPRSHPEFSDQYAVHVLKVVDGVKILEGAMP